jgi:hypothetical protein
MTDRFCTFQGAKVDETRHFIDTLSDAVTLRLEPESHPEDAMCIALDLINAWAIVHVDGSAEYIYHSRDEQTITTLRAEIKELQALYAEDKERWERELRESAEKTARLAAEVAQRGGHPGAVQSRRSEGHRSPDRSRLSPYSAQSLAHNQLPKTAVPRRCQSESRGDRSCATTSATCRTCSARRRGRRHSRRAGG